MVGSGARNRSRMAPALHCQLLRPGVKVCCALMRHVDGARMGCEELGLEQLGCRMRGARWRWRQGQGGVGYRQRKQCGKVVLWVRSHSHSDHGVGPGLGGGPGRPLEGLTGVDEHILDDVSSYIFRRLRGVLGPLLPDNFDPLDWLPIQIHNRLHKSEIVATLLVRELIMFGIEYFIYTKVDSLCRWLFRMYSGRVSPGVEVTQAQFDESLFKGLRDPFKFTVALWSVSRGLYSVAPLFKVKMHLHWVGNSRAVGLIVALTWFLFNWKSMFVQKLVSQHKDDAPRIYAADKVVSLAFYYLAASATGEIVGFGLRSLLAVGGISSIAVGLAAKEIVSNFFGGTLLFVTRPFVIGEKIKAGQFSGTVQDIGFLQTKILGFDRVPILVPNQAFINQVIINYSRAKGKLLDAVFPVRNQDVFLVERITSRVLRYLNTHPDVDKRITAPLCYLKSFGSMGMEVALQCVIPTKSGIDFFQAQQRILVRVAQIIVEEGASLGSTAPFSPAVPDTGAFLPST